MLYRFALAVIILMSSFQGVTQTSNSITINCGKSFKTPKIAESYSIGKSKESYYVLQKRGTLSNYIILNHTRIIYQVCRLI